MQPRAFVLYKQTGASTAIVDGVTQSLMMPPSPIKIVFALENFTQILMSAANKKVIVIIKRVLRKILQVQESSKHVNKHKKSTN